MTERIPRRFTIKNLDVSHTIPSDLQDKMDFPDQEVKVKRDDEETDLDSMTPSEKIEWAREKYD